MQIEQHTLYSASHLTKGKLYLKNGECLKYELSPTYLGITFDKRLTWKSHIGKAEKKAKTRLTIVRKLGSKWGANMKTLNKACVGNVRPALKYGMATCRTAAKSNLDRLTKVQKSGHTYNDRRHKVNTCQGLGKYYSPCVIGKI